MTQMQKLKKIITRYRGVTSLDIVRECGTVTPSRRVADLRDEGWDILKVKVDGKNYYRYWGTAPK